MAGWGSRIAINKGATISSISIASTYKEIGWEEDKRRTKRRLDLRVTVARDTMGVARDNTVKIRSVARWRCD